MTTEATLIAADRAGRAAGTDPSGSFLPAEAADDATATAVKNDDGWLAPMQAAGDADGYLESLGPRHWAFFAETGTTLVVTFESADAIRARDGNMPAIWPLAQERGWSVLTLIAQGETFWRTSEVWGYFDRLIDDAFFDDFPNILFYGAGPAGHAAAAYMVAAPGARALLVAPRATMAPELAGWDRRHLKARRLDFTSRYGFAPDMTEGAGHVWLVHDPLNAPDAAHAALFRRPWVTTLNARLTGENTERFLRLTGVLDPLIEAAATGRLTPLHFARAWRARRDSTRYLNTILAHAVAARRPAHEAMICRSSLRRLSMPRLAQHLARLEGARRETDRKETDRKETDARD